MEMAGTDWVEASSCLWLTPFAEWALILGAELPDVEAEAPPGKLLGWLSWTPGSSSRLSDGASQAVPLLSLMGFWGEAEAADLWPRRRVSVSCKKLNRPLELALDKDEVEDCCFKVLDFSERYRETTVWISCSSWARAMSGRPAQVDTADVIRACPGPAQSLRTLAIRCFLSIWGFVPDWGRSLAGGGDRGVGTGDKEEVGTLSGDDEDSTRSSSFFDDAFLFLFFFFFFFCDVLDPAVCGDERLLVCFRRFLCFFLRVGFSSSFVADVGSDWEVMVMIEVESSLSKMPEDEESPPSSS